jgi:hypothetical protein
MSYVVICLLVLLLGFAAATFYLGFTDFQNRKELRPLSPLLLAAVVAGFVVFIVFTFFYFVDEGFSISNNLGQVGDFIGGLSNPVLSFLALLALLRTTQIQTTEAKKTTSFMARQQELLEREKFENTFFQLLDRLEKYCDDHLRKPTKEGSSKSIVTNLADKITSRKSEFDGLLVRERLTKLRAHVFKISDTDLCICFMLRALRVLQFVEGSKYELDIKSAYVELLRDTMLPDERVVLSCYAFFNRRDRAIIKRWNLGYLNEAAYASKMMYDFYER